MPSERAGDWWILPAKLRRLGLRLCGTTNPAALSARALKRKVPAHRIGATTPPISLQSCDAIQRTSSHAEASYLTDGAAHDRRTAMKKLLGIVVLLTVIIAEAFSYTASACTGTYAGYPCSQWNQMRDRW